VAVDAEPEALRRLQAALRQGATSRRSWRGWRKCRCDRRQPGEFEFRPAAFASGGVSRRVDESEALPRRRFSGQWYGPRDSGWDGGMTFVGRDEALACSTDSSWRCSRKRKPTASRARQRQALAHLPYRCAQALGVPSVANYGTSLAAQRQEHERQPHVIDSVDGRQLLACRRPRRKIEGTRGLWMPDDGSRHSLEFKENGVFDFVYMWVPLERSCGSNGLSTKAR